MTWDGIKRRDDDLKKAEDHDTLIEVVQILKSHVANFDKHVEKDDTNFKDIKDQVGKHAMWIYIGLGVVGTIQFLIKH